MKIKKQVWILWLGGITALVICDFCFGFFFLKLYAQGSGSVSPSAPSLTSAQGTTLQGVTSASSSSRADSLKKAVDSLNAVLLRLQKVNQALSSEAFSNNNSVPANAEKMSEAIQETQKASLLKLKGSLYQKMVPSTDSSSTVSIPPGPQGVSQWSYPLNIVPLPISSPSSLEKGKSFSNSVPSTPSPTVPVGLPHNNLLTQPSSGQNSPSLSSSMPSFPPPLSKIDAQGTYLQHERSKERLELLAEQTIEGIREVLEAFIRGTSVGSTCIQDIYTGGTPDWISVPVTLVSSEEDRNKSLKCLDQFKGKNSFYDLQRNPKLKEIFKNMTKAYAKGSLTVERDLLTLLLGTCPSENVIGTLVDLIGSTRKGLSGNAATSHQRLASCLFLQKDIISLLSFLEIQLNLYSSLKALEEVDMGPLTAFFPGKDSPEQGLEQAVKDMKKRYGKVFALSPSELPSDAQHSLPCPVSPVLWRSLSSTQKDSLLRSYPDCSRLDAGQKNRMAYKAPPNMGMTLSADFFNLDFMKALKALKGEVTQNDQALSPAYKELAAWMSSDTFSLFQKSPGDLTNILGAVCSPALPDLTPSLLGIYPDPDWKGFISAFQEIEKFKEQNLGDISILAGTLGALNNQSTPVTTKDLQDLSQKFHTALNQEMDNQLKSTLQPKVQALDQFISGHIHCPEESTLPSLNKLNKEVTQVQSSINSNQPVSLETFKGLAEQTLSIIQQNQVGCSQDATITYLDDSYKALMVSIQANKPDLGLLPAYLNKFIDARRQIITDMIHSQIDVFLASYQQYSLQKKKIQNLLPLLASLSERWRQHYQKVYQAYESVLEKIQKDKLLFTGGGACTGSDQCSCLLNYAKLLREKLVFMDGGESGKIDALEEGYLQTESIKDYRQELAAKRISVSSQSIYDYALFSVYFNTVMRRLSKAGTVTPMAYPVFLYFQYLVNEGACSLVYNSTSHQVVSGADNLFDLLNFLNPRLVLESSSYWGKIFEQLKADPDVCFTESSLEECSTPDHPASCFCQPDFFSSMIYTGSGTIDFNSSGFFPFYISSDFSHAYQYLDPRLFRTDVTLPENKRTRICYTYALRDGKYYVVCIPADISGKQNFPAYQGKDWGYYSQNAGFFTDTIAFSSLLSLPRAEEDIRKLFSKPDSKVKEKEVFGFADVQGGSADLPFSTLKDDFLRLIHRIEGKSNFSQVREETIKRALKGQLSDYQYLFEDRRKLKGKPEEIQKLCQGYQE